MGEPYHTRHKTEAKQILLEDKSKNLSKMIVIRRVCAELKTYL